jgi:hypothetical protein
VSAPRRDGDLDSDIPWHEYGHGLTWRMIGNMSGPLSGAVGEGNSDVLSILTNDDDVVGEYAYNNPVGIRSEPYEGYSRTYGDFTGSSVHFDGEIYAATLWDLKQSYVANGTPVDTLWDDMVGGMSFTPAGPAFEDMRDGILQQAAGSRRECLIWESFAMFGIGVGAKATIKGGGPFGGGSVTVTESFDLPTECGGGPGTCTQTGAACSNDADCCSGSCSGGKPSTRVCLLRKTLEHPLSEPGPGRVLGSINALFPRSVEYSSFVKRRSTPVRGDIGRSDIGRYRRLSRRGIACGRSLLWEAF